MLRQPGLRLSAEGLRRLVLEATGDQGQADEAYAWRVLAEESGKG